MRPRTRRTIAAGEPGETGGHVDDALPGPPCPHDDPACPCPDGLACHYEDSPARTVDGVFYPATRALPCPHCLTPNDDRPG